jgi:enoyl-CoA hydratase/carnithine racemase
MDIETDQADGLLRIGINRPQKKNAITADMYRLMAEALAEAERTPAIKAVLIHGTPAVFSAGNDLQDFMINPPSDEGAPVFRFLLGLAAASKPLVAAVTGAAVGVGTTLLLHCDLVYAGQGAQFRLPFTSLGLCPEAGSSLLLPAIAGHQRAAERLLLGEPFGPAEARELGLVNEVLPDDQVLDHARAQARKLAALSLPALQATKRLMKRVSRAAVEEQIREEAVQFRQLLVSPEAQQAFAAFFARRKPEAPPGKV